PLTELKFVLCVPDRLCGKSVRLPGDLAGLPLALPAAGGSFHGVLSTYFESVGIPWQPAVESTSFLQALALVESGGFAAVLPSIGAKRLPGDAFVIKPIAGLKFATRKLVLHWNKRQMETRDVSAASIRKLRDAIRLSL
ncbi:MAG: DNA-binding transcriptional LysR family regulator, partial [Verrucomicrobiales bacterium]